MNEENLPGQNHNEDNKSTLYVKDVVISKIEDREISHNNKNDLEVNNENYKGKDSNINGTQDKGDIENNGIETDNYEIVVNKDTKLNDEIKGTDQSNKNKENDRNIIKNEAKNNNQENIQNT